MYRITLIPKLWWYIRYSQLPILGRMISSSSSCPSASAMAVGSEALNLELQNRQKMSMISHYPARIYIPFELVPQPFFCYFHFNFRFWCFGSDKNYLCISLKRCHKVNQIKLWYLKSNIFVSLSTLFITLFYFPHEYNMQCKCFV